MQFPPPTEADRIALTNMFRAIAEYGRRIRLRKLAEAGKDGQAELAGPATDAPMGQPATRKSAPPRKRKRDGTHSH
jgi:hypothetical protein